MLGEHMMKKISSMVLLQVQAKSSLVLPKSNAAERKKLKGRL
jgi:hypothetical protein